jgi:hypothetical protein
LQLCTWTSTTPSHAFGHGFHLGSVHDFRFGRSGPTAPRHDTWNSWRDSPVFDDLSHERTKEESRSCAATGRVCAYDLHWHGTALKRDLIPEPRAIDIPSDAVLDLDESYMRRRVELLV